MNDNVYIKSTGFTKTQVNDDVNSTNWTANYDGNVAKLSMNIHDNGSNEHIKMQMNNDDLMKLTNNKNLMKIFNTPTVEGPIHERLRKTYLTKKRKKPIVYIVNVPASETSRRQFQYDDPEEEEPFVEEDEEPFVEDDVEEEEPFVEEDDDEEEEPFVEEDEE